MSRASALAAVVWGALVLLVTADTSRRGSFSYPIDDPYIHLRFAELLSHGTFGVAPGQFGAPCSSIVWPLLLAPLAWTGPAYPFVPLAWNLVFGLLTIHVVALHLESWLGGARRRLPSIATLCVVLSTNLVGLTVLGMEHTLQVLVAVALVAGLPGVRRGEIPRYWPALVVLGPLVRYESLSLSVPALLVLFRVRPRLALGTFAALALALGGFSAFLLAHDAGPLPSSIVAKSLHLQGSFPGTVLDNLLRNVTTWRGAALLAVSTWTAFVAWRRGEAEERATAGVALAATGLHLAVGSLGWFHRYEPYLVAATLVAFAFVHRKGLRVRSERASPRAFAGASFVAVLAAALWYIGPLWYSSRAGHAVSLQQREMARFAREIHRKPIGVNDLGWVSFRGQVPVLDLFGLGSRRALQHRLRGDPPEWMAEMAREAGVEVVMIYRDWFPRLPGEWLTVGHLTYEGPMRGTALREVSFLATSRAAAARLSPELEAFAASLPNGARFVAVAPPRAVADEAAAMK